MFTSTSAATRRPSGSGFFVERCEQPRAVDRMKQSDRRQAAAELVALHVADEMPADRQIGQRFGLRPQFLRPAFAQVVAAGSTSTAAQCGGHVFGHRDQRHGVWRSAAGPGGRGDAVAQCGPDSRPARCGPQAEDRSFDFDQSLDGAVAIESGRTRIRFPDSVPARCAQAGGTSER